MTLYSLPKQLAKSGPYFIASGTIHHRFLFALIILCFWITLCGAFQDYPPTIVKESFPTSVYGCHLVGIHSLPVVVIGEVSRAHRFPNQVSLGEFTSDGPKSLVLPRYYTSWQYLSKFVRGR